MKRSAIFLACALAVHALLPGRTARAESWERPWGLTAGVLALSAGANLIPGPENGSPWQNPIDDEARNLFRAREVDSRIIHRLLSDITLTLAVTAPAANAIFSHYQADSLKPSLPDREWMGFSFVQAMALNYALTETLKRTTARTRPRSSGCDGMTIGECNAGMDRESHKSFPSGHTSFAFAGAGLICQQTTRIRSGKPFIEGAAWCPVALGLAGLTGLLRIRADEHWLLDILAGAAIGLGSSFLAPPVLSGGPPSGVSKSQATQAAIASPLPILLIAL